MENKPTTRHLEEILTSLENKQDLVDYLRAPEAESPYHSFIEYFRSLPKTAAIGPADLYLETNIERSYCYKIFDGKKRPGRDKILLLCIAAKLNNTETRRALEAGREAPLYSRNTRDAVIFFAIEQELTVNKTNELLDELGLPILE